MPTKSELKILARRVARLREFIETTKNTLAAASGQEMHVAITVSARIMNVITRTFDVGLADDPAATYEINRSVVRLVKDDKAALQDLRARLVALYERMLTVLDRKTNSLAKADASV